MLGKLSPIQYVEVRIPDLNTTHDGQMIWADDTSTNNIVVPLCVSSLCLCKMKTEGGFVGITETM